MQNSPLAGRLGWAEFEYDFAKDGGAIGTIALGEKILPPGALILGGLIWVKTACLGTNGTMQLMAVGADDILAATNVSALTLNALIDVVPVYTAATAVRCTAHTRLTMTIATTAFTAGVVFIGLAWGFGD